MEAMEAYKVGSKVWTIDARESVCIKCEPCGGTAIFEGEICEMCAGHGEAYYIPYTVRAFRVAPLIRSTQFGPGGVKGDDGYLYGWKGVWAVRAEAETEAHKQCLGHAPSWYKGPFPPRPPCLPWWHWRRIFRHAKGAQE